MDTSAAKRTVMKPQEVMPVILQKRIGSTNYIVSIHFSRTSKETLNDKILRLVKKEAVN